MCYRTGHFYHRQRGQSHNAVDLQRFELVVWNNVSGDVLTESQRRDLRGWIEAGGGEWPAGQHVSHLTGAG